MPGKVKLFVTWLKAQALVQPSKLSAMLCRLFDIAAHAAALIVHCSMLCISSLFKVYFDDPAKTLPNRFFKTPTDFSNSFLKLLSS